MRTLKTQQSWYSWQPTAYHQSVKQWFLSGIIVCLGLVLAMPLSAQDEQLFPDMPGMVSYTYRNSFSIDVEATLDTLQSMGIKDMEFSSLFGETAENLRKMLDDRGMECTSYGVGYDELVSQTLEVGQTAQILGAQYVRVAWIPYEKPFSLSDAQKAVHDFNQAGKVLKEEFDLVFCYHNHGYEFHPHGDGTLFDFIIQETDPAYVGFEMDILWTFFPGADPTALLEKYGNRFKLIHLKDLRKGVEGDLSGGTAEENDVALGCGQLDIPSILVAAKAAGIRHYYIEDESPAYFKQVPKTIKYLHSLKK